MPIASFFTACPIHSKCISHRCRRRFAFLQFLVFRVAETSVFAAFSCLRVVNTSKFRVFPVFGSLFTGVQVGKERIHSRNFSNACGPLPCGKGRNHGHGGRGGYLTPSLNFVGMTSLIRKRPRLDVQPRKGQAVLLRIEV